MPRAVAEIKPPGDERYTSAWFDMRCWSRTARSSMRGRLGWRATEAASGVGSESTGDGAERSDQGARARLTTSRTNISGLPRESREA